MSNSMGNDDSSDHEDEVVDSKYINVSEFWVMVVLGVEFIHLIIVLLL